MFTAPFYQSRSALTHFCAAIERGHVTIGFLGGSITDSRSRSRWSDMIVYQLCSEYPDVSFQVINTAIGATNSMHALFRVEQDILSHPCDLVFVEYAVNDADMSRDIRQRTREGLIRKLWQADCDLVFTYTFDRAMLPDMTAHRLPERIAGLEEIAEHYHISSIFMSSYALDCLQRGLIRWEEWLPDDLHPENLGSRFYAKPVMDFLKSELSRTDGTPRSADLPAPLNPEHFQKASRLPFSSIRKQGPWFEQQPLVLPLVYNTLSSFAPGASLSFDFEGTGAVLCVDFGVRGADFQYRIDGGDWQTSSWERPAWFNLDSGWLRLYPLAEDLPRGSHTVELTLCITQNEQCRGCNFDLCYVGILP